VRIVGKRLPGCALLLVVSACVHRPLAEADGDATISGAAGQGGATGQGGGIGTGCSSGDSGLELIGTPLTVLDQPPTNGNLYTSLLWTGEEYLFIWRLIGSADVLMQRIDANGQAVGGNIRVRNYENALDVAWGRSRLAAVWSRNDTTVGRRLMFQTFDGLGRPLIEETTLRASAGIAYDGGVAYGPRIAAITEGFVIVWSEGSLVWVATVDVAGYLLIGPMAATADLRSSPFLSLAADDERLVVGWTGVPATPQPGPPLMEQLTGTLAFSSGLTPLGDTNTLDTAAFYAPPQLLTTGIGFLAFWTHGVAVGSTSASDAEVRIAQLDGRGASVANGLMDPPARGPIPDLVPAVWNGDHLVVLWGGKTPTDTGLTLSRFAPGGARQGTSLNLPTSAPASRLYLTAHDGTLAFIWSEEVGRGYEVYFQQARSCP
jgi:hypothetical protein